MKRAFLAWALINSVFVCLAVAALIVYGGRVHSTGRVAMAIVLATFALASAYNGRLAWLDAPRDHLVDLGVSILPMLALLGTASGFLIAFSGSPEDVQQRVAGASTGLAATITGIACAIVLMLERALLQPKPGCGCGR